MQRFGGYRFVAGDGADFVGADGAADVQGEVGVARRYLVFDARFAVAVALVGVRKQGADFAAGVDDDQADEHGLVYAKADAQGVADGVVVAVGVEGDRAVVDDLCVAFRADGDLFGACLGGFKRGLAVVFQQGEDAVYFFTAVAGGVVDGDVFIERQEGVEVDTGGGQVEFTGGLLQGVLGGSVEAAVGGDLVAVQVEQALYKGDFLPFSDAVVESVKLVYDDVVRLSARQQGPVGEGLVAAQQLHHAEFNQ